MDDPRNLALEAAITADPHDREAYLVYADWLEGQGDPRAKLIALQCSTLPSQNAGKAVRKQLAEYQKYLLGPLASFAKSLTWRYGFVHQVSLVDANGSIETNIERLISHPSARFLVELSVSSKYLDRVVDRIAAGMPATLQVLNLGGETAVVEVARLAPLLERLKSLALYGRVTFEHVAQAAFAKLTSLTINVTDERAHLPALAMPELGALSLRGPLELSGLDAPVLDFARFDLAAPTATTIDHLVRARWPKLRRLELDLGNCAATPRDLAPLFERTDLGELRQLIITRGDAHDALAELVAKAPFASQLQELALTNGSLTADGVSALALAGTLDKLESLDVTGQALDEDACETLAAMGVGEVLTDRYDRFDE